ncbi:Mur ligase family protein [Aerococcus kribbianus]|uniref:UDP-N-acetylmuramyl-tripeptide synthetase n=1 Tax=Aerococcus kribbianus TaxID=2999064 RepID=A0A9X3FNL7_9LACT|nr:MULTISPECIES: UDP-N-acetylmuramoyl-L-alanyl-D-glutamate--2,6-diaminopimelate ligase [unclassified Aerococcus]MCZ0717730.1 UDP-N-acetylmuramoyl-L-alanyl-D-glutamate--2,6-diaminopimelate ligase [Aerococcus sp. YH-aer221]MCZ0726018.1 UDP-N-acetylmuramoyl-L-alanyl-D-glutamate--2,6-diaminopimelate ligase [Aerococcus sp. YH-aer222]
MTFKLSDIADKLSKRGLLVTGPDNGNATVTSLTYDSREVSAGTLFFCKGAHFRVDYLKAAQVSGAVAYVSERDYGIDLPALIVKDVRQAMPIVANYFYDQPWQAYKLAGITGTKGKTTTTTFLKKILDCYEKSVGGKETAYFSSTLTYDGVDRKPSALTTPESLPLFEQLDHVRQSGIDFLTMEVSSQALKYHRVDEMSFDVVGFLNISTDHIGSSEHPNFEDYFQSKLRLFDYGRLAVINWNTDYRDQVLAAAEASSSIEEIITFSRDDSAADYWVDEIRADDNGQTFKVHHGDEVEEIHLGMPGIFNIDNALMALIMARAYGVSYTIINQALSDAKAEGRMEVYRSEDNQVKAIVDYAHNKLSMEQLIEAAHSLFPDHLVWVVTGSAGDKGQSRRQDMGQVIGQAADKAYLTSDDYNFEDPSAIASEIAQAIYEVNPDAEVNDFIHDRHAAISQALSDAQELEQGVVVLVAGKGSDAYFLINGQKEDYQADTDFIQDYINHYNSQK